MLQPTLTRRERNLLYGPFGAGKTRSHCTIAAWARRTGSPARFFVLDADGTMEAMEDGFPSLRENTTVYDIENWGDCKSGVDDAWAWVKKFRDSDGNLPLEHRNHWLVVDPIGFGWDAVQEDFALRCFGKPLWEITSANAEQGEEGNPLRNKYIGINAEYMNWVGKILRWPGHVLVCAKETEVKTGNEQGKGWKDAKPIIDTFGRIGVKPKGQKDLGHQFHTVLHAISVGNEWRLHTVKDREREKMVNKPINDFVLDYLVPYGKWEV